MEGKNNFELEFILNINNRIIPLDVKKGKGRLNSVLNFRLHNPADVAIKISKNNYGYDETNKLPLIIYGAGQIDKTTSIREFAKKIIKASLR